MTSALWMTVIFLSCRYINSFSVCLSERGQNVLYFQEHSLPDQDLRRFFFALRTDADPKLQLFFLLNLQKKKLELLSELD